MTLYYKPIEYVVSPEEDGLLLKTLLQKRMGVSRKLLSRLKLTEQGIMLNGERVYISVRVSTGDLVQLRMEQEVSEDILPEPIPFDILYEDEHLLVVNKAAGMIVHPTHGHYTGTLANGIVHYWRELGLAYRFRPVHRLDQETSGALAIAKNPYVHQHISEQMIAGTVDKLYTAFVHGSPPHPSGMLDGPIDRDPLEPHRRIVTPTGYPALTKYQVEQQWAAASKVSLKLESGRTHQIRVHMTHLGCSLIGDKMYKHRPMAAESPEGIAFDDLDMRIERHALHASKLALDHPITRVRLVFQAPLPEDMASLERYLNSNDQGGAEEGPDKQRNVTGGIS